MKRSNLARRRSRNKKLLNKAVALENRAWDVVTEDTKFRETLARMLLSEKDFLVEHPKFGTMRRADGHPALKPLLLERIRNLLELEK